MKNELASKAFFLVFLGFSFLLSSCTEVLSNSSTASSKDTSIQNEDQRPVTQKRKKLVSTKPPVRYRIADLPVPDNYRLDEDKSFIFETVNLKTGILVYSGGSDMTDVVEFYKEEMPKYGWSLVHLFQHKEANMLFEKEDWVCNITLKGSWSSNSLSLRIAPKDPGSAPPPNK